MKRKTMMSSVFVAGSLALGSAALAAPSAEMLANTCAGCHGTNGVSQGPASPIIAGISKDYFIDAMKSYREGERAATIMTRIAKGYNDEDVAKMAEFFSKQKFVAQKQPYDETKAKKGFALHDKYCEKCHEDGGRSAEDDAGILAGQWTPYLKFTFTDFMNGDREMPKKMKKRIDELKARTGDTGFDQLLNFYASQDERK